MKYRSVIIGKEYTIITKGHPAEGRKGIVVCKENNVVTVRVGHFNCWIYKLNSGQLK